MWRLKRLFLCNHLPQRKLSNKRGPPILQNRIQKKGNTSDTVARDKVVDSKNGKKETGVIRWSLITNKVTRVILFTYLFYLLIIWSLSAGRGRKLTLTRPQKAPRKIRRVHVAAKNCYQNKLVSVSPSVDCWIIKIAFVNENLQNIFKRLYLDLDGIRS